jgi:drug/metabolite transporter (DMT)-like permease
MLQATVLMAAMSLGAVWSKGVLDHISPLALTWVPIAIGLVASTVYTCGLRRERFPSRLGWTIWLMIAGIGIGNYVLNNLTRPFALQRMPATTVAYLGNFVGFLTMALSIPILQERPSIFQVLGAGIALGGTRLFYLQAPSPSEWGGMGLMVVGISGLAFTNNIARKLAVMTEFRLSNNLVSTAALAIGGIPVIIVGIAAGALPDHWSAWDWFVVAFTGLVSIAVGLALWNNILRTLRSYEASILGATSIIWTALWAIPLLGEHLDWNQIGGMALMIVGLILVQVRHKSITAHS